MVLKRPKYTGNKISTNGLKTLTMTDASAHKQMMKIPARNVNIDNTLSPEFWSGHAKRRGTAQPMISGGIKAIAAILLMDIPTIAPATPATHMYMIADGTAQLATLTIFVCRLFRLFRPYHKKPHPIIHRQSAAMTSQLANWALIPPKREDTSA